MYHTRDRLRPALRYRGTAGYIRAGSLMAYWKNTNKNKTICTRIKRALRARALAIGMDTYICIYVYIHKYIYIYIYIYMQTHIHIHTNIFKPPYLEVYVCVCIYTHIYLHISADPLWVRACR